MKKRVFLIMLLSFMLICSDGFYKKVYGNDSGQVIEDGVYEIETGLDSSMVLDVINAYTYSGANVQIFKRDNYAQCQKVSIKYIGNGCYNIFFEHSGKALDVANAVTLDHTNVWQCNINGADAQKWMIKDAGNGYYYLISKCANKYLTVANSGTTNCTNIEIKSFNGNNSQKFKLNLRRANILKQQEIEQIAPAKLEEGIYEIETAVDSSMVLDVINAYTYSGANVQIFKRNNYAQCQKVEIKNIGNGYYNIIFEHSKKALDVANAVTTDYTNVWQCNINGADAQKWMIKEAGNGYYYLVSKCANKYLTVSNGGKTNCTNIEINSLIGDKSQKFKLNLQDNSIALNNEINQLPTVELEEGIYEIETGLDSSMVLDVINAYTYSGANVQIFKRNNYAQCQKVKVKKTGDGYYNIIFEHSGKALDVANAVTLDHTNVWQCNVNGADAQKWMIKDAGNGYYYLISKCANKYLTVANGGNTNCTNIEINSKVYDKSQMFKFNIITNNNKIVIDQSKYPRYQELINQVLEKHPSWNIKLLYTGLKFSDAVYGEYSNHSANLVSTTSGTEWICSVCGTKTYDTGEWYGASQKAIAYYMDPRNFINENNIFQFLDVNKYTINSISLLEVQNRVNGTFLQNYARDIITACNNKKVNPYYVIARLIQENGINGSTTSLGMNGGDGKTYYNPFNIGAYRTANATVFENALKKAKEMGWDSMGKALEGGIDFLKKNWLDNYQNTLYQNKFDIDRTNGTSLYTHQYMQNLSAAYSEGISLKKYYANSGKLDTELTFIIPVYEGMSYNLAPRPSDKIVIGQDSIKMVVNTTEGTLALRSEANTSCYVIARYPKGTIVTSLRRGINGNWHYVVTNDGKEGYMSGTYLKQAN